MEILIAFLLFWLVCGVLAYGIEFAYWQREWPTLAKLNYHHDMLFSAVIGCAGPLGLYVALLMGNLKHGVKFF